MRRNLLLGLLVGLLLPFSVGAQTVDEVIAKNIQARGGMEKIKAIQTVRTTGKFSQDSFRAVYVQENKRQEKVREELIVQGLAQVQAYDGKTGWQINPFRGRKDAELMSQDDTKTLLVDGDIDGLLVDYREKGHQAELLGHDSLEGTDCFKIKLTEKNGDIRYYFLDADSYLELKIETQSSIRGEIQYTETWYGDYEQIQGVYFPFAIESNEVGSDSRQKFMVEKIEVNVPLDNTLFSMPAGKAEAKPSTATN
jgi:hypothetical protein